jgi:hypothetical protein
MNRTISGYFAIIVGLFLLTEGIWGEFSDSNTSSMVWKRIVSPLSVFSLVSQKS